ncbi:hypothetical protein M0R45_030833 [Rubus argutus]|uniref:DUF4283 domain-containing protein n=1 Tax=Rubus argutus TaxID=59490 RepID=A0AAW1WCI3_RUBAR
MASSSSMVREIPYEDEDIIEVMSVVFDNNDLIWKQIRIIWAKKNIYSIRVGSEKLARRLIECGPWNVKGFCFTIRHWPLYHSVDDIEPTRATDWIQAHGIPREMLSVSNGRKLGSMLGSVIEVEDPAKVNPILIKLGVVYDQSLVADAVQKPAFTIHHHPIEFPYLPVRRMPELRQDGSTSTSDDFQKDSTHWTTNPHGLTNSREDGDRSLGQTDSSGDHRTLSDQSLGLCKQGKRLDLWHPDTNGTIFRNGSETVALNGIKLDLPPWADSQVIPPWAFNCCADFEKTNPHFPVPGFDNNSVLVQASTSFICIVNLEQHMQPNEGLTTKPTT